jgi:hypothetical protein
MRGVHGNVGGGGAFGGLVLGESRGVDVVETRSSQGKDSLLLCPSRDRRHHVVLIPGKAPVLCSSIF